MLADYPDQQIGIEKVPHGVVVGITAGTSRRRRSARKSRPALAAGNTIVLKPSEETPLTAMEIVELARQAGIWMAWSISSAPRARMSATTSSPDDKTQLVSMTGSAPGGRQL